MCAYVLVSVVLVRISVMGKSLWPLNDRRAAASSLPPPPHNPAIAAVPSIERTGSEQFGGDSENNVGESGRPADSSESPSAVVELAQQWSALGQVCLVSIGPRAVKWQFQLAVTLDPRADLGRRAEDFCRAARGRIGAKPSRNV